MCARARLTLGANLHRDDSMTKEYDLKLLVKFLKLLTEAREDAAGSFSGILVIKAQGCQARSDPDQRSRPFGHFDFISALATKAASSAILSSDASGTRSHRRDQQVRRAVPHVRGLLGVS